MCKIIPASFFSILLLSFTCISDVFQQIGTTLTEAKQQTLVQLAHEDFDFYGLTYNMQQACKKLPPVIREATVAAAAQQLRAYIESPAFKNDYDTYLANTYPMETFNAAGEKWEQMRKSKEEDLTNTMNLQVPGFDAAQTFAQQLDAEIAMDSNLLAMDDTQLNGTHLDKNNFRKDIADNKMLKNLFAKDKAAFKKKYVEIAAARDVRNEMLNEKNEIETANAANKAKINGLGNYKSVLRKQLQQFIDQTAGIDFNAQLKQQGDIKVFVNPGYESKPGDWKFYYRCGREYVTSARKFAQDWLKSMQ